MFGRARKGKAAGWTAVEAGSDGIVAASVRSAPGADGKPRVVKCGHLPDTNLDVNTLGQISKKVAAGGFSWTLPLNRGDYKIFVVPQPSVAPEEMDQSVRWSLGPMLDFSVEDATVDWMKIPTEQLPKRPPHLYVIAAHRDVVAQRTDPFKKAKLPLEAVDIRETAQRNIALLLQKPGEGVGMVALGNGGVQLTFTYGGELYLDRYMETPIEPLISGDADTRERTLDRITVQVQRSIDFMDRTYPFISVSRIVLAPLPAPVPLRDYLTANVTVPVEALDLASIFDFSESPELMDEENQALYFTALGAALRGMDMAQ